MPQELTEHILEVPKGATALLVLAHGAGAGMRHVFMEDLAKRLQAAKIGTLRYQFPYMERGSKRPDPPKTLVAAVAAACDAAMAMTTLPIFAGGKSMGGRMTTTAASQGAIPGVRGIICFGFPLHPAKEPSITRAAHLAGVEIPTLFLQGTRDDLAEMGLMTGVVNGLPKHMRMHVVEKADHGFAVLKSSGRTADQVLDELVAETVAFTRA